MFSTPFILIRGEFVRNAHDVFICLNHSQVLKGIAIQFQTYNEHDWGIFDREIHLIV